MTDPPDDPPPLSPPPRGGGRAIVAGLIVFVCSGLLVLSPLLIGRSPFNRFLVAFGFIGACLGLGFILHGGIDWLRGRR